MSAELALIEQVRTPTRHGLRQHGYVAVLSLPDRTAAIDLERGVARRVNKALHRRLDRRASARVRLATTPGEVKACWRNLRGRPLRAA